MPTAPATITTAATFATSLFSCVVVVVVVAIVPRTPQPSFAVHGDALAKVDRNHFSSDDACKEP